MRPTTVYLCDWLPPDFGAVGQYALQRARSLAAGGRRVALYGLSSGSTSVEEEDVGSGRLKVVRLQAPVYDRTRLLQRAWWTLRTDLRLVWRAWRDLRQCTEILFTGSPPFLLHVVAPLNLILGKTLVYRITDFFPECLIAERGRSGFLLGAFYRLTLFWRRRVHRFEVLGEDQRRRLAEIGIDPARVSVVRDPSPVEIRPGTAPLDVPAALAGKKVLLYSGNFGVAHDHETFLAAYERHHREGGGRVGLWLNAQGGRADALEAALRKAGLPFVRTRPLPLEQLAALLVTPAAHLITLRDAFVGYVLPSKVYGCIESGRDIVYVGSRESDVHALCAAAASGRRYWQVDAGDAERLYRVLEELSAG